MSWRKEYDDGGPRGEATRTKRYVWTGDVEELARDVERNGVHGSSAGWAGQRREQLAANIRGGDLDGYAKMAEQIADIGDQLREWDTFGARELVPSVCGPRVSVGAYLAGSPTPYRRRVAQQHGLGPVKIIADMATSAMLDAHYLRRRGVALLALAMQVQRFRPVELWAACGARPETRGALLGSHVNVTHLIQVDAAPFDLSRACALFGSGSLARTYVYALHGRDVSLLWPRGATDAELFGAGPEDIVVPGARSWEPMVQDPVKYIAAKLGEMVAKAGGAA